MTTKKKFTEIKRTDKQLFVCPFCNKEFRALAYHTRQRHEISAKKLRKMFGLKSNYQLITPDLKERHRELAIENKEGEKLIRVGEKTRYKKGSKGHIRKEWSEQAIYEMSKRQKSKGV